VPVLAAAADYEDLGDGLWAAGFFRFLRSSFEDAHGTWSSLGAAGLGTCLHAGLHTGINVGLSARLRAVLYATRGIGVRASLLNRLRDRLRARLDAGLSAGLGAGFNERTDGRLRCSRRFNSRDRGTGIHASPRVAFESRGFRCIFVSSVII
jgi:hypothetical protein